MPLATTLASVSYQTGKPQFSIYLPITPALGLQSSAKQSTTKLDS